MVKMHESWLFVPAISKYLFGDKIQLADVLILDLEDSLRAEQKGEGLKEIVKYLCTERNKPSRIYVRLNLGKQMLDEIMELRDLELEGFMIPKFESVEVLERILPLLNDKKIIVLVETPLGIINLPLFAHDPHISGLAFGAEDFCKELNVPTNEIATFYARSQLVLYAAINKKISLDTVFFDVENTAAFENQYMNSLKMGFTSKLLIHPSQVAIVNSKKNLADIEEIRHILTEFYNSSAGIVNVNGKWYEKPHIENLEKELEILEGRNYEHYKGIRKFADS